MTGEWHSYVDGPGDGEVGTWTHIVGFLPDSTTPEGETPLCEIVVTDQRDARLLRDFLRGLDANPRSSG